MPENIFSKTSAEKEIFQGERALMPDYLPEVMPHREKQIEEIAYSLRGAAEGKRTENVLIFGTSGTRKTSSVTYVLKQLQEYSQKVVPIYVNCWESAYFCGPPERHPFNNFIKRIIILVSKKEI